jgi:hypothetical protein
VFDAFDDIRHNEFDDRKRDVKDHGHDNDGADVDVPIWGEVIVLPLKKETDLSHIQTHCELHVEDYHN